MTILSTSAFVIIITATTKIVRISTSKWWQSSRHVLLSSSKLITPKLSQFRHFHIRHNQDFVRIVTSKWWQSSRQVLLTSSSMISPKLSQYSPQSDDNPLDQCSPVRLQLLLNFFVLASTHLTMMMMMVAALMMMVLMMMPVLMMMMIIKQWSLVTSVPLSLALLCRDFASTSFLSTFYRLVYSLYYTI